MFSVPAKLGKGRGAKEIGHKLARERNKIWAQFCGQSMKTRAQICKHCTVHQLFENTKTEIICNFIFIFLATRAGCYVDLAGRKGVQAGRKTVRAGRSTLRNMPCWNTVVGVRTMLDLGVGVGVVGCTYHVGLRGWGCRCMYHAGPRGWGWGCRVCIPRWT